MPDYRNRNDKPDRGVRSVLRVSTSDRGCPGWAQDVILVLQYAHRRTDMTAVSLRLPDDVSERLRQLARPHRAEQDLLHPCGPPGTLRRSGGRVPGRTTAGRPPARKISHRPARRRDGTRWRGRSSLTRPPYATWTSSTSSRGDGFSLFCMTAWPRWTTRAVSERPSKAPRWASSGNTGSAITASLPASRTARCAYSS